MAAAALITWLVTAAGGFVMLGMWTSRGGHRPGSGSRLTPGLVFGHFALAALGLVLWIGYLAVDTRVLAWIAFALLLPVVLIGFTMLARWIPARHTRAAELRFPVPVVIGHGVLAATTLVLVFLSASGVGGVR
jgi:hypothetical protein